MTERAHLPFYRSWLPLVLALVAVVTLPVFLFYDRPRGEALKDVRQNGALRVLTVNSPTTFYEGPNGPTGFEYDLARGLADLLRVDLVVVVTDSAASVPPLLMRGDAHFAAAGLVAGKPDSRLARFSLPYHETEQQVVYLRGRSRPREVADLVDRDIEVVAGSRAALRLNQLKVEQPELSWVETTEKDAEALLYEVGQGRLDVTIADSNMIALSRQHYPALAIAFSLGSRERLAWAFPPTADDSVFDVANSYLKTIKNSGELAALVERYYGTTESFDHINISRFKARVATRLPEYESFFREAEAVTGIDWRLLAAQAYQESQWDPEATSPTGVKGIMQLTRATAQQMEVANRRDPRASILGGARYMVTVDKKIPARIAPPDRTWLSLAAYNIGFGHLEDARVLTERAGQDPDRWVDVKSHLPLLEDPDWYSKTRRGKARGNEAVAYVTRVRTFYDVLVRMDSEQARVATDS